MTERKTNWVLIFAGILLLAISCLCFFYPNLTLTTISIVAGIFFVVSSVADLIAYFRKHPTSTPLLAYGILDFILGLVFLTYPFAMADVVP